MCNDLLTLGPFTVHGYGLMIGLGIVAALTVSWRRADRRGLPQEGVTALAVLLLVAGFLGAKLFFILSCFDQVRPDPLQALGSEGFVVYGGILFGLAAGILWCRKKKQSVGVWADLLLPGIALAQGFGRIGCFLAGCCYGAATRSPLGVVFPAGSLAPAGVPLWPTQLFSAAGDFLLAGILFLLDRRDGRPGHLLPWYLLLYGVGRFLVEFLRDDPRGAVGALSTSQFVSLFIVAGAAALFALRKKGKAPHGE